MPKDILLMGYISQYNVLFFFDQIKEALKDSPDDELVMRVNTTGGEPDYLLSIMEKAQELKDQIRIKGNAQMHSAGFFLMCYVPVDRVEVCDVTQGVLHRAAYPKWMEESADFKGSTYELTMIKTNKDLEKALRARVDVEVLESLPQFKDKNLTLKDVFALDSRIDIVLTGADMKKIGLASKVNKITPTKAAQLNSEIEAFKKANSLDELRLAASHISNEDEPKKENSESKNTIMNLDELKSKHPEVYSQAKAEGIKDGAEAEKDRVEAIMVFADIDPEGVKTAIASGKPLSAKQTAEMTLKAVSKAALKGVESDSTKPLETEEGSVKPQTEDQKKLAAIEAELDKKLGLGKK